jgi:uncharacterized membrane protein YdbT with pleckstrin-like domain
MGYASATCGVRERILYRAHYHWLYWMTGLVLTVSPSLALAAGPITSWAAIAVLGVTLLLVPFGLVILVRTLASEIVVTSDRFIRKSGLISFDAEDISLDKIEEVDLKESILGAILGYGTLEIHGSGTSAIIVEMVQMPERLRKAIETAGETSS